MQKEIACELMWASSVEKRFRGGYLMYKTIFFVWQILIQAQEMQEHIHYHSGNLTIVTNRHFGLYNSKLNVALSINII